MVVPEDPESVFFFVNFTSGTFEYWSGFGPKATPKTQDIKGWFVAFKTSFGLLKLATVPEVIVKQITLLKVGSYSASQMILGFSAAAAAKIVWNSSKCPGLEENPELRYVSQNMFQIYMDLYMQRLATGPYSVLGYTIKVDDFGANTKLPAPSFPPTAVKCRTQAYLPRTPAFKEMVPSRAGFDSFIFQTMTEQRAFPDVPYNPSSAGNWIVGGIAANLALSNRIFFKNFICPKFEMLNMQCIVFANDAYDWIYKEHPEGYEIHNTPWKLDKGQKPETAPWNYTENGASYSKKFENLNNNNSKWWEPIKWENNYTTVIDNKLTFSPGSDTINLTVNMKMNLDQKKGTESESGIIVDHPTNGETTISWSGSINLGTIKDGMLQVDVKFSNPTVTHTFNRSDLPYDWTGNRKRDIESKARKSLELGIKGLKDLESNISKAMNPAVQFRFPRSRRLFHEECQIQCKRRFID